MTSTAALLDLALRSAVVSGIVLILSIFAAPTNVAQRLNILRFGLALLLLLPVTMAIPAIELSWLRGDPVRMIDPFATAATSTSALPAIVARDSVNPDAWLLNLYFGGMLAGLLWTGAGIAVLAAWTRSAKRSDCRRWNEAVARFRAQIGARRARLLVSSHVRSPLSWGFRNPVILVDTQSHARPEQADAIVAHEIAHIARRDWATLLASRAALALFWFNPLVWLLHRALTEATEHAADLRAIAGVDRFHYADVLISQVERHRLAVPANAIVSHPVRTRIGAIVRGPCRAADESRSRLTATWTALAIIAPMAAFRFAPAPAEARPVPPMNAWSVQFRSANAFDQTAIEAQTGQSGGLMRRRSTPPARHLQTHKAVRDAASSPEAAFNQSLAESADANRAVILAQARVRRIHDQTEAAYQSGSPQEQNWADGERGRAVGDLGRATGDAARANAQRIWAQIELERLQRR